MADGGSSLSVVFLVSMSLCEAMKVSDTILPSLHSPYHLVIPDFRKILKLSDPTSMAVFQTMGDKIFNKFVIHYHSSLVCYSLDIFARVALGQAQPKTLDASFEKITSSDVNVLFFRQAKIGSRLLSGCYLYFAGSR